MIVRCWGEVNGTTVEFSPIPNREGYWEGLAPRVPGLQDIKIWAEKDNGSFGYLSCQVAIQETVDTYVRVILLPYSVSLINKYIENVSLKIRPNEKVIWCRRA